MGKIISTDFGSIHDALNKMIIAEVKAALELLPEKCIEVESNASLCRIVVSPGCDYQPRDVSVRKVWLDEGGLHITGFDGDERTWTTDYDEDDDWLDITDFQYLIGQIAEKVEGEHDIRYKERSNIFYSKRKICDKVKWIDPDGNKVETYISGIIAEQEPGEPTEIIYTTNIMRDKRLSTAYLTETAILN